MSPTARIARPVRKQLELRPGERLVLEATVTRPEHPSCYRGEWVCDNVQCPAQEVRLHIKGSYAQHLPPLRCPACQRLLTFRHWLRSVELARGGLTPSP